MRWTVHGERGIYDSEWIRLRLADIELPGGGRFEHHVLRFPREASGTVVHDPERGILLLWRHRFITDTWGWEIPAGGIDAGETPEQAAARETLEETGWASGPLTPMLSYHPSNGVSDQTVHLYRSESATRLGDPQDPFESDRVEWLPLREIRHLIRSGQVPDGVSLTALLWVLAA
ncbi:NUDIX hydrolase [Nocardia sp. NPDC051832]|uniref:NUDIX hydrolase n=1 Tax=Nocardia sp. NPDC051832 TaxID=3155673 RepID=UPI00341EB049